MAEPELGNNGWTQHNIWEHSAHVRELYARRAQGTEEEMTCAAQAAELLEPLAIAGDSLLDAGCGSGYFFHSVQRRRVPVSYFGIDATETFIRAGRSALPAFGLPQDRLQTMRIEDFRGSFDHVLCMNVLSNLDNYHRPLERLLQAARKSVILRESVKDGASYSYVVDRYLDGDRLLRVHVNSYDRRDIISFISGYGFDVTEVTDRRTAGAAEMVIDHPHWWSFLVARRKS